MKTYIVRKRFILRLNRRKLDVELLGEREVPEGWLKVDAESETGAILSFVQDRRFEAQMWTLDETS